MFTVGHRFQGLGQEGTGRDRNGTKFRTNVSQGPRRGYVWGVKERLYLRNKTYWCWYYDADGRLIRETTKCTDRTAARAVLKRKEQEAQGATPSRREYVALGDVLDALEERVEENTSPDNTHFVKSKCKQLRDGLGKDRDVHSLRKEHLKSYATARLAVPTGLKTEKTICRYTVSRELKVLYQAIKHANKEGLCRVDITPLRVEFSAPYVPRKRWLSRDEYTAILEASPEHRRLWIIIATYTGARASEVESLAWEDIRGDTIHIRGTKTPKSDRNVPLHPALAEALGKKKKGVLTPPWPNVQRDLRATCKRLGIDAATPNDLRRTFASWLLQAGVSNSVVAELLGHATTQLVDMTYGRLSAQSLAQAVALI